MESPSSSRQIASKNSSLRVGSSLSGIDFSPLATTGGWRRAWNVFVFLSLAVAMASIAISTATWGVMYATAKDGFEPFVVTLEQQKLRACLLAARDFGTVARSKSAALRSHVEALHRKQNLTALAIVDSLTPLIDNSDLDALYVGFFDGTLVGLEQNVLEPRSLTTPFTSLFSNATGLVLTPVDPLGRPVGNTSQFFPGYNATQRLWFQNALLPENQQGAWSSVYLSGSAQFNTITWPLVCYDATGRMIAVVGADVSLPSAFQVLSRVVVSESGRGAAWLYDADGNIIAVNNETMYSHVAISGALANVSSFENIAARDAMSYLIGLHPEATMVNSTVLWDKIPEVLGDVYQSAGELWLVSVMKFVSVGANARSNFIVAISPRVDYFSEFDRAFTLGLAISLGLVTPLAAVLVALLTYIYVARPLNRVSHGLEEVATGRFITAPVPRTRRKYCCFKYSPIWEIGGLERTYDKLLAAMSSFSKYVPSSVANSLLVSGKTAALEVVASESTVFFSDIAGFTTISESTPPTILVSVLAEYFEEMVRCIEQEAGTVGDYIGDAVFAFWETDLHAAKACAAACSQQERLAILRHVWQARGWPAIHIRIGLDTGAILAGNIGSSTRFKFTAVGGTVDESSRYEDLNKEYGTSIMISESTWAHEGVKEGFVARVLDIVAVKGKSEGVVVLELLGRRPEAKAWMLDVERLSQAWLDHYRAREWDQSLHVLAEMQAVFDKSRADEKGGPDKGVALLMDRIQGYRDRGVH